MKIEWSPKALEVCVWAVLVVLSMAMFANSMVKPVGRDEQMYCTGGVLLGQGKLIYQDFSYPAQMPYHPLLYAAVYKLLGTRHYLLVGRIISTVCDVGVLLCIMGVYRRVFGGFGSTGLLLGLAGAVLYVFNPLVDYANGYAWNHDVVIFLVMLSLLLFVGWAPGRKRGWLRIGAIGVLLAAASFMRITTALAAVVFFAVILVRGGESWRARLKSALPFVVGAGLASLWPVWVIVRGWEAFRLNLVTIPSLYGEWLAKVGMVHGKGELTIWALSRPGYLALLAALVYVCLVLAVLHRYVKLSNAKGLVLSGLLVAAFFIVAFIPPTMWRQYMAVPVPFMVIFLAFGLLEIKRASEGGRFKKLFRISCMVLAACTLAAVMSNPAVAVRIPAAIVPEVWVPLEVHRIAEDIAAGMEAPKRVLTFGPLFALEGGCEIYTELSAGAIVYRAADGLTAEERAVTHTVGPGALSGLVEDSPASAVILGVDMEVLERSLLEMARKAGWERRSYEGGPVVYFSR